MFTTLVIVIVAAAAIAAVLGYASTKPATFRIERATTIQAPADKIFPLINDFHNWTSWSPWEKMDPDLKRTYSGAPSGPGAVYAWQGNRKVGQGRMEIVAATPPSSIAIKLDFLKPFEAHNMAEFSLAPQGDSTRVTWAMHGPNLLIGKAMSLVVNMDRMIGKDFETGLANLKALAEREARA